jgi:hypothetical protein
MNLSLEIDREKKIDVYSFFNVKNTIQCPQDLWLESLLSSLRRKHQILILEEPMDGRPRWDARLRWQVDEQWIWLSSRSFSFLNTFYQSKFKNYSDLKVLLRNSK